MIMNNIKRLTNWLNKKETTTFFSSYSTLVVGIATIVVSIFNLILFQQQNNINKTISQLQIAQNQPFFVIYTDLVQDSTDGKYGTEHLFIENHGFSNTTTSVNKNVLFQLTRCRTEGLDTVVVIVDDYFWLSSSGSPDLKNVYHSLGPSNNRRFFDLYMKALNDRKEDGTFFLLEKSILVQITYSDLLGNGCTKYYINGMMVDKQKYEKLLSKAQGNHYTLSNLDYESLKGLFEKKP